MAGIAGCGMGCCGGLGIMGDDLKGGIAGGIVVGIRASGDLARVEVLGVGLGIAVDRFCSVLGGSGVSRCCRAGGWLSKDGCLVLLLA